MDKVKKLQIAINNTSYFTILFDEERYIKLLYCRKGFIF
jgi:hypothetical protein